MHRLHLLLTGLIVCLVATAQCQWQVEPVPGQLQYHKPVAEDTMPVGDSYNRKYAVNDDAWSENVHWRDTIIISPLYVETKRAKPPYLRDDVRLLQKAITYPPEDLDGGVQGACFVFFKINKTGGVDSIWVQRSLTRVMDKVVINAVKSLPLFVPAKRGGKPVVAICYYKIRFRIYRD